MQAFTVSAQPRYSRLLESRGEVILDLSGVVASFLCLSRAVFFFFVSSNLSNHCLCVVKGNPQWIFILTEALIIQQIISSHLSST